MKIPEINDKFTYDFSFTEENILAYAKISGDANPIHITESYAKHTIFKRCIVHGYFSISIFSKVYGTLLYPEGSRNDDVILFDSICYRRLQLRNHP